MSSQAPEPSNAEPITLFLSYAHHDEVQARKVADALEQAGYTLWWDALIEGGAAYSRTISSALEAADAIIVLWSTTAVESDWVRDEAAKGRERRRLIPLSLDGVAPPLGFGQYQVIDFSHWRGSQNSKEFNQLERAIAVAVRRQPIGRPRASTPFSRRKMMIAGGATAAVVIGGGTFLAIDRDLIGGDKKPPSIAVLPFKNLSGDPEQAYFSEGLTEEVRAALIRLDALDVLAATSTEKAHEEQEGPKSIARELRVGYLLGGSVRKSGDIFRIATELTDGKTGFGLWSTTIDRSLTNIFAVQSEIARMVAEALSIQIAVEDPVQGGTENVDSLDHYLKGKSLFHLAKDEDSDRKALAHYELAIAEDPGFAMAHAGRARVLAAIAGEYARADELKPMYASAVESARKAVELAPKLADGQLALGYALFAGQLDVKGARPHYDLAYQLGRGNADILLLFALYCSRAGRTAEAHAAIERAALLDPINARTHRAAGSIDYAARRYAAALAPLKRSLELNPKITFTHSLIGNCLMQLGRLEEAKAEFELEPLTTFRLSGLAIVEHRLDNRAAAEKALSDLVAEMGDAALYQQAEVMAQLGKADEAVARLVRARQVGDSGLIYLATDPLLDPIRQHPGFAKLIKDLNVN